MSEDWLEELKEVVGGRHMEHACSLVFNFLGALRAYSECPRREDLRERYYTLLGVVIELVAEGIKARRERN